MADTAASYPLFPILEPALSTACSRLSAVMIPKEIGVPDSRDTVAIPLVTSVAM